MGQFDRKIISFEVTVTEIFEQNKHNKCSQTLCAEMMLNKIIN